MSSNSSGRPFEVRHKGFKPRPKPKPKKWQYQDDLDLAIGSVITLNRSANRDGGLGPATIEGVLLSADQFTIKIRTKIGSEVTHFKHALNSYAVAKNG